MLVWLLALAATPRPSAGASSGTSAWTFVASGAAVIAALAALATAWYARETVTAARKTTAVADAARRADERHRLEGIAELLVDLRLGAENFRRATSGRTPSVVKPLESLWVTPRDRLEVALVGLHERLPRCAELLHQSTALGVEDRMQLAEEEAAEALRQLDTDPAAPG